MKQLPFLHDAAGRSTASGASATPAVLNPSRPAIIVPVQATEASEIARQCADIAAAGTVDVIEWRIDPVIASIQGPAAGPAAGSAGTSAGSDTESVAGPQELAEAVLALASSVISVGLPVLVTLRTGFEGGVGTVSEDDYTEVLGRLIEGLSPREGPQIALDVEIDRLGAAELITAAHAQGIRVAGSHHNFADTDDAGSLFAKFSAMSSLGADVAKVAMMPRSAGDVLGLLRATAEADAGLDCPVLGISMGQLGRTSRVMGADFGSCASFAQLGESSAPGQIDVADLAGVFDRLYS